MNGFEYISDGITNAEVIYKKREKKLIDLINKTPKYYEELEASVSAGITECLKEGKCQTYIYADVPKPKETRRGDTPAKIACEYINPKILHTGFELMPIVDGGPRCALLLFVGSDAYYRHIKHNRIAALKRVFWNKLVPCIVFVGASGISYSILLEPSGAPVLSWVVSIFLGVLATIGYLILLDSSR